MHKSFYASGFLYHCPTQQILLQQSSDDVSLVLFGGKSHNGDLPQVLFQRSVESALGVTITASAIHSVYDYIHDTLGEHFIFYVEVAEVTPTVYAAKQRVAWFPLSKLSKAPMSEQTRHDIIVGERVIRSFMEPLRVVQVPRFH